MIDDQSNKNMQNMMTSPTVSSEATSGKYGFCSQVVVAVADLKNRLRDDYEGRFPESAALIRSTIDAAAALAWETKVPHLVLPELVAEKVARLIQSLAVEHGETRAFAHAA
jgi:hypothetical protein